MASVVRHTSRPDPAHDITISEDNIALASFNQSCYGGDASSLTIVDCNTDTTKEILQQQSHASKQNNPVINLPKIAAKQTQQKANNSTFLKQ